jgi:CRISPR-associated exonuclease Cas4
VSTLPDQGPRSQRVLPRVGRNAPGPWLTVTDVLEHAFCPRYTYFEGVLGLSQRQELRTKVLRGRAVHRLRASRNRGYRRKRLNVVGKHEEVFLACPTLGVHGRIDEALRLADGTASPLDYKVSPRPAKVPSYTVAQAVLYAILLEATWEVRVERAFLVYLREPRGRHEIQASPGRRRHVLRLIREVRSVRREGLLPSATPYRKRCLDCSFRFICPQ